MWPVPIAIGVYLAPESPWWLVRRGRLEDAKRALIRLTDHDDNAEVPFNADQTISMMVHTNESEREQQAGTSYLDLFKGVNLRRTEIVCVTWTIQSLCGASFMGYSTYFYQNAGLSVDHSFTMALGQYAMGAAGTIASWFLITRFGRRTLYFWGLVVLFVFLLTIGCASFAGRSNIAAQWAIGSLLIVYTLTYNCTVGPVCYSLVSELPSVRLRTKSVVMARNCYNMMSIVANIITPSMLNPSAWDWGARSGFFFAGTCFCCALWTFFRLPEPRGRTYTELDVLFERRVSARKFASAEVGRLDVELERSSDVMEKAG